MSWTLSELKLTARRDFLAWVKANAADLCSNDEGEIDPRASDEVIGDLCAQAVPGNVQLLLELVGNDTDLLFFDSELGHDRAIDILNEAVEHEIEQYLLEVRDAHRICTNCHKLVEEWEMGTSEGGQDLCEDCLEELEEAEEDEEDE